MVQVLVGLAVLICIVAVFLLLLYILGILYNLILHHGLNQYGIGAISRYMEDGIKVIGILIVVAMLFGVSYAIGCHFIT